MTKFEPILDGEIGRMPGYLSYKGMTQTSYVRMIRRQRQVATRYLASGKLPPLYPNRKHWHAHIRDMMQEPVSACWCPRCNKAPKRQED